MTKKELYSEFLKNFPRFESNIKSYYKQDDTSISIYTKQGGSFIFEKTDEGISLHKK